MQLAIGHARTLAAACTPEDALRGGLDDAARRARPFLSRK
jgi:hypothetical protein